MTSRRHLTILGAGPAGLATGYYASKHGIPFTLYEASGRIGGNAVTLRHGDFLYDSGAHRLHDKESDVTAEIQRLLGRDLQRVDAPSQIYLDGRYVSFPLVAKSLVRHLGLARSARAAIEVLAEQLRTPPQNHSLENLAVHAYGRTIASLFLLNYSEKLWGLRSSQLSSAAAGTRLDGLRLRTVIRAALGSRRASDAHFEGSFLYPKYGIGQIAESLGDASGRENIICHSRITGVRHDGRRVQSIQVNKSDWHAVDDVVSTLPIDLLTRILDPAPPPEVMNACSRIRYRNLVLVTLAIDKVSITPNATVYFPGSEFVFTRVSEPRNRSPHMAPEGKTSLLVEIPCDPGDAMWTSDDQTLVTRVTESLTRIGWIAASEILDARVSRMSHAYPVAELGLEEHLGEIFRYLQQLENLRIVGRNAQFTYTWIHLLIAAGKRVIEESLADDRLANTVESVSGKQKM